MPPVCQKPGSLCENIHALEKQVAVMQSDMEHIDSKIEAKMEGYTKAFEGLHEEVRQCVVSLQNGTSEVKDISFRFKQQFKDGSYRFEKAEKDINSLGEKYISLKAEIEAAKTAATSGCDAVGKKQSERFKYTWIAIVVIYLALAGFGYADELMIVAGKILRYAV